MVWDQKKKPCKCNHLTCTCTKPLSGNYQMEMPIQICHNGVSMMVHTLLACMLFPKVAFYQFTSYLVTQVNQNQTYRLAQANSCHWHCWAFAVNPLQQGCQATVFTAATIRSGIQRQTKWERSKHTVHPLTCTTTSWLIVIWSKWHSYLFPSSIFKLMHAHQ